LSSERLRRRYNLTPTRKHEEEYRTLIDAIPQGMIDNADKEEVSTNFTLHEMYKIRKADLRPKHRRLLTEKLHEYEAIATRY